MTLETGRPVAAATETSARDGYDRAALRRMLRNEADMSFRRRAEAIFDFLEIERGDRVLDMGSGRGFYLKFMRRLFPWLAPVGVELDRPLLDIARTQLPDARVVNANVYRLPFGDAAFDKIVFSEVIEHIPDDARAMRELYRVLAPGGLLALTTPNADYPFWWDPINKTLERTTGAHIPRGPLAGIWANHVRLYALEGLLRLATDAGFTVEAVRPMTHYCFPFIHNLVYGIGKPLLERELLPGDVAQAADRFNTEPQPPTPFSLNPVRVGLWFFEAFDALNDIDPPRLDRSFLGTALKLRKPSRRDDGEPRG